MHITVLDDDPGQGQRINSRIEHYAAWLDGTRVVKCVTADDVKGEVVVTMADEKGKIIVERGKVKQQTLDGQVRIERL